MLLEGWTMKKQLVSLDLESGHRQDARSGDGHGAWGGKILGAGGAAA